MLASYAAIGTQQRGVETFFVPSIVFISFESGVGLSVGTKPP